MEIGTYVRYVSSDWRKSSYVARWNGIPKYFFGKGFRIEICQCKVLTNQHICECVCVCVNPTYCLFAFVCLSLLVPAVWRSCHPHAQPHGELPVLTAAAPRAALSGTYFLHHRALIKWHSSASPAGNSQYQHSSSSCQPIARQGKVWRGWRRTGSQKTSVFFPPLVKKKTENIMEEEQGRKSNKMVG